MDTLEWRKREDENGVQQVDSSAWEKPTSGCSKKYNVAHVPTDYLF